MIGANRTVRILVASGVSLMMGGCASWTAERQAAHDSANERTEMIGRTVETLSGASRTVTTDSRVDEQGKPFVRETVTTTPGNRQLISIGFTLEPGAEIAFANRGTGAATVEIGVAEPVASMTNAYNDSLEHAAVSPDELMRTFAPEVMRTMTSLSVAGFGTWGIIEIQKNNKPTIVEQPPAQIIEVPTPLNP